MMLMLMLMMMLMMMLMTQWQVSRAVCGADVCWHTRTLQASIALRVRNVCVCVCVYVCVCVCVYIYVCIYISRNLVGTRDEAGWTSIRLEQMFPEPKSRWLPASEMRGNEVLSLLLLVSKTQSNTLRERPYAGRHTRQLVETRPILDLQIDDI